MTLAAKNHPKDWNPENHRKTIHLHDIWVPAGRFPGGKDRWDIDHMNWDSSDFAHQQFGPSKSGSDWQSSKAAFKKALDYVCFGRVPSGKQT